MASHELKSSRNGSTSQRDKSSIRLFANRAQLRLNKDVCLVVLECKAACTGSLKWSKFVGVIRFQSSLYFVPLRSRLIVNMRLMSFAQWSKYETIKAKRMRSAGAQQAGFLFRLLLSPLSYRTVRVLIGPHSGQMSGVSLTHLSFRLPHQPSLSHSLCPTGAHFVQTS